MPEINDPTLNFPKVGEATPLIDPTRDFPSARGLPEIDAAPQLNEFTMPAFRAALGLVSASGQDERAQIINSNFSDVFNVVEDAEGNLVARSSEGDFALNAPGLSTGDVVPFFFRFVAALPSGRAKSEIQRPLMNLLSRSAQVGAKSAGTEAILQGTEALAGGEFDADEVGLAAGLGTGVELALGGRAAVNSARVAESGIPDVTDETLDAVAGAQELTRGTGIQFNRAQSTLDPFLVEETSFVAQLPEGARDAINFIGKQNDQVAERVRSFVGEFGNPESVEFSGQRIRSAAQKAVALREGTRAARSSPLYQEAFREFRERGATVDLSGVVLEIDRRIAKRLPAHPASKALVKFKDLLSGSADDLEKLQDAKEIVDIDIANLAQKTTSASKKATREISEVQDLLLDAIDEVSPLFANARATFARESTPVDAIRASLVGKVARVSDEQIDSIAATIFQPNKPTNAVVVRNARRAIEAMPGGDQAWTDIVRTEIERRLGSIRANVGEDLVVQGEILENIPSQMRRALFPNKKARDVLFAALDTEQRRSAKLLEDALRRASVARGTGSQTGVRKEISDRLGRGIVPAIGRFISAPLTTIAEGAEDAARSARIRGIAEVAFNPDWAPEVNRIRQLAGNQTDRWVELFTQVTNSLAQASRERLDTTDDTLNNQQTN